MQKLTRQVAYEVVKSSVSKLIRQGIFGPPLRRKGDYPTDRAYALVGSRLLLQAGYEGVRLVGGHVSFVSGQSKTGFMCATRTKEWAYLVHDRDVIDFACRDYRINPSPRTLWGRGPLIDRGGMHYAFTEDRAAGRSIRRWIGDVKQHMPLIDRTVSEVWAQTRRDRCPNRGLRIVG